MIYSKMVGPLIDAVTGLADCAGFGRATTYSWWKVRLRCRIHISHSEIPGAGKFPGEQRKRKLVTGNLI
ncbi:hypothetical protein B0J17DRAFT_657051 [Rhizoctonia solani]|nr:hypothetical protein B0J17DRAFT_657051 [Rhizoctonia solani]